jgi:uncharacterized protein (DUF1778 family)
MAEPNKGGRPPVENPRNKRVMVNLTDDEHALITEAAEGQTVGVWIREKAVAAAKRKR